jgi:hypothetical protein
MPAVHYDGALYVREACFPEAFNVPCGFFLMIAPQVEKRSVDCCFRVNKLLVLLGVPVECAVPAEACTKRLRS